MPGLYRKGDFDIAGFSVGAVENGDQLTGSRIRPNDVILGLGSSGFHSNGYSLIRAILGPRRKRSLAAPAPFDHSRTLGEVLLAPTKIYVKSVMPEIRSGRIKALAHITGGGLLENVKRVFPKGLSANIYTSGMLERVDKNIPRNVGALIDIDNITKPNNCFSWLQREGNISAREMLRTFNCGIGMVVVVGREDAEVVIRSLQSAGEKVDSIGTVAEGEVGCTISGHAGSLGQTTDWLETCE
jgi:phosphoribosylformylglycinamidine cyclo-ligase